jgi:hypothetical protein
VKDLEEKKRIERKNRKEKKRKGTSVVRRGLDNIWRSMEIY